MLTDQTSSATSNGRVPQMLLSVEEAAAALGVHRSSVFDLLRRGALRSVRIGRRRLISVAALDDFIRDAEAADEQSVGAVAPK